MAAEKNDNPLFNMSDDGSDNLANKGLQVVEIYHVPTAQTIRFKAMLTEFTDTFVTEWNSENVYGRMDPLLTYQRTGRSISIGFDLAAYRKWDAMQNLARVQALSQFLYPVYDAQRLIKNSPLCKIQFMNWSANLGKGSTAKIGGLLGNISGFSFSPVLDAGVFGGMYSGEGDGNIFPKILNVSFNFTVIHEHQLGWKKGDSYYHFADYNDRFPYGQPARKQISPDSDNEPPAKPKSEAQQKAVPNDAKETATANSITDSNTSKSGKPSPKKATSQSLKERLAAAKERKARLARAGDVG